MGCEVRWTASARKDVEDLVRHIAIALGSPKAAGEHVDAFESAAERLSEFPESCAIGARPPLKCRSLRACFVKRYVMLYSYDGERVTVHRVFHTMQDYARLIEPDESG